jgi:hypothetical protein
MRFVSCTAVSLRVAQRLLVSIDGSLIRFASKIFALIREERWVDQSLTGIT